LQSGASAAADRRSGQMGLFGDDDDQADEAAAASLPDVPDWDERDQLAKEKEVLGYYLSSHPLAEHEEQLATYCSHTTTQAAALKHRTEVMLGGMLASIKFSHTKNPKPGKPSRYAMFDLEDKAGIMRTIIWPEQFERFGEMIQPDAILVVRGSIDKRPGSEDANLIVNEVIPLDDLEKRYTRGVRVRISEEKHGLKRLDQLHEILRGYPGNCDVQLSLWLADGKRVHCKCDDFRVEINSEMRTRVDQLLGPGNFRLVTAMPSTAKASSGQGRGRGR